MLYGYPQDWIRTLGPRIAKVHLKDFKLDRREGTFAWKNLGEGDIDWPEVRQAFADVRLCRLRHDRAGRRATPPTSPTLAARVDRILAGEKPSARLVALALQNARRCDRSIAIGFDWSDHL